MHAYKYWNKFCVTNGYDLSPNPALLNEGQGEGDSRRILMLSVLWVGAIFVIR
jgi:hypothetical protein